MFFPFGQRRMMDKFVNYTEPLQVCEILLQRMPVLTLG